MFGRWDQGGQDLRWDIMSFWCLWDIQGENTQWAVREMGLDLGWVFRMSTQTWALLAVRCAWSHGSKWDHLGMGYICFNSAWESRRQEIDSVNYVDNLKTRQRLRNSMLSSLTKKLWWFGRVRIFQQSTQCLPLESRIRKWFKFFYYWIVEPYIYESSHQIDPWVLSSIFCNPSFYSKLTPKEWSLASSLVWNERKSFQSAAST